MSTAHSDKRMGCTHFVVTIAKKLTATNKTKQEDYSGSFDNV
ncbi:hypothetical protein SAMN05443543_11627 [Flavobacterium flevense]|nr:hypothetical protein SAMN05443543_11627 [Flavobacterium flevense]